MLIDSHCHIHDSEFFLADQQVAAYDQAIATNVSMICVGTSARSSREAIEFCQTRNRAYAVIGVHPHDAKDGWSEITKLLAAHRSDIVGIGEIGLDYYYNHSPREVQIQALEAQLQLALDDDLPLSFHVRDAFDDFWPIYDNFRGIRGVLHSFTDSPHNLEKGLERGLYIGVNGISTFTKDAAQRELYSSIPLEKLLLETDAPFLTPAPFRGKINVPTYVSRVAEVQADARHLPLTTIASTTTANARALFGV